MKRIAQPKSERDSRVEEVVVKPVEVITVLAPSPVRSTSTEKRAEVPISGQAFAMSIGRKKDDRTSESTKVEWQPVAELRATEDSRLVQANPPIVVSGGVDDGVGVELEVVREAMATGVQVCHIDGNNGCSVLTLNFGSGFT